MGAGESKDGAHLVGIFEVPFGARIDHHFPAASVACEWNRPLVAPPGARVLPKQWVHLIRISFKETLIDAVPTGTTDGPGFTCTKEVSINGTIQGL